MADLLGTLELPLIGDATQRERVHAAILAYAQEDEERLLRAASIADMDWRDVLVAVHGMAYDDWPRHVDELLGPQGSAAHD